MKIRRSAKLGGVSFGAVVLLYATASLADPDGIGFDDLIIGNLPRTQIAEPGTLALLAGAAGVAALIKRRRQKD